MSNHPTEANQNSELRIRPAARALVLTPSKHILLVRFEFPAGTRWALPGGGLDDGEDHVTALRRELIEEVGLHNPEIGPHIWTREHRIPFINGQWDGQREHIHLVQVPEIFEPQPALDWDTLNAEYLFELRWWHIDEIAVAQTTFVPSGLHTHVMNIIENRIPSSPINVEV
jgi:8-oxo-dGTP pyrophosphatase MutT (NUDIX family)